MLTIRLNRVGVRRKPVYRIVVTEKEAKKGGPALDILGFWQPGNEKLTLEKEKIIAWQKRGAKISKAVLKLLEK